MVDEWRAVSIDAAAGFAAGVACTLAFQPLDTVLTRQQYNVVEGRSAGAAALVLLKQGGGPAFWRGTAPLVALVPLQNALLMIGYGAGERWGRDLDRSSSSSEERAAPAARAAVEAPPSAVLPVFLGGCVGGLAQSFVASPLELAKVRRQLFQPYPSSPRLAFRGLGATFSRDVVPHGVWFLAYDQAKARLRATHGDDDAVVPVAAGALAATVAWVVGYPFDLLKTRIQGAPRHLSLADAARDVLRAEARPGLLAAVGALYRGLGLKLLRAVPSSGLNFFVYESAKRELDAKLG